MTKSKKFLRVVMAVGVIGAILLSSFAGLGTASAKETYELTINNTGKTQHQFEVYQIFKGDLSKDGQILSNIKWGQGVKGDAQAQLGEAQDKAEALSRGGEAEAAKFAQEVKPHLDKPSKEVTIEAGGKQVVSGLEAGYYMIIDKAKTQSGKEAAYTAHILKVVGNTEVKTKLDVPTVEKKVKDINDTEEAKAGAWQDSADYDIGDKIPYQLKGTLPGNYDKYEKYHYEFIDTMSKGLTLDEESVKVYVDNNGQDIKQYAIIDIQKAGDGQTTLSVKFEDLKDVAKKSGFDIKASSKIIVEYQATLNDQAVIGANGNPNEVYLKYSNNPNKDGDGDYGETPRDKNIVFTYTVRINKLNEQNRPLEGAEFTLFKKLKDGKEKEITAKVIQGKEGKLNKFEFKGLDDGTYVLRETKVPDGYNKIQDIAFKIEATHDEKSDDPKLTHLTAKTLKGGQLEFTRMPDTDTLSTDVINKKGITLPQTGGMGTGLLYVVGIVLVVSAGFLRYTGRKRNAEKMN